LLAEIRKDIREQEEKVQAEQDKHLLLPGNLDGFPGNEDSITMVTSLEEQDTGALDINTFIQQFFQKNACRFIMKLVWK